MGNQPSKDAGVGSSKSGGNGDRAVPENLQSYPSFSKSDTKESSRSFRSLRSKIPGTGKTDSPRSSAVLANGDLLDRSDSTSVKHGKTAKLPAARRSESLQSPSSQSSADTAA